MTTNCRSAGGTARRVPAPRSWARPPGIALLALALIGLVQGGCKSDGCSTCGFGTKLTSGFNNGVAAVGRVFNHKDKGGCKTCGGGDDGAMVEGTPIAAPGAIVMPGSGTIVPAPALESAPSQLEALPANPTSGNGTGAATSGGRAASPTSTRGGSVNSRSAYEAYVPKSRRAGELARAMHSTPEPVVRADEPGDSSNLFDKIPPVDLPADVTRKATSVTSAPSTAPSPGPAPVPAPAASNPVAPTSAENHSAVEGTAVVAASTAQAPGIRRSASVAPTLGGGSVPSVEGLEWLKEKGYKTFVDLRQGTEVEPTFADAVNDRGMVYISLPIMASRLEPNRLARFDDLISRSENRPLYFCDADGSRAGLVWYIHLRAIGGEDSQSAAQKAEEVGLTEAQLKLADAYLAIHKPKAKVALASPAEPRTDSPEPPPAPPVATAAEVANIPVPALPADSTPASAELPEPPVQLPPASDSPPLPRLPGDDQPEAFASPLRDVASWRPVAALVLTGVGVPLAYWSRSALSVARTSVRRASLPGATRRSLEAPASSDA